MSGAKATDSDPLPSNEALEAELAKERRETEDLLAAFDRPGGGAARSVPSGGPGFVEYYAGDARAAERSPREPRRARPAPPRQAELATVVKRPRRRVSLPPWLFWAGVSAAMLGVGFVVAVLTTRDPAPRAAPTTPVVSAAPPAVAPASATGRDDEVPAPDPTPAQRGSVSAAPPVTATTSSPRPQSDVGSSPRPAGRGGAASPPASTSRAAEDGPIRRL